jgi:hypothetical protein
MIGHLECKLRPDVVLTGKKFFDAVVVDKEIKGAALVGKIPLSSADLLTDFSAETADATKFPRSQTPVWERTWTPQLCCALGPSLAGNCVAA